MKVAIVTELYLPHLGGQEVRFAELAEALVRGGHDVDVYCIGHDECLPKNSVVNGVRIHRLVEAPRYTAPKFAPLRRDPWAILRFSVAARRAVSRSNADVAIYNQWPLLHIAVIPRQQRARAMTDWCEVREGRFWGAIQRHMPRLTAGNLGVSTDVAREIAAASGRTVIPFPSGVNVSSYSTLPESERSGILYLGRMASHKRLDLLLEAHANLMREGFAEPLTIAGDGPEFAKLRSRVLALGLEEVVHLPGIVTETRKRELLARSKLLVITSEREGFPRIVAEAMASGLPVVTTNDTGNGTARVVSEFGVGLVVAPDAASVADGIDKALVEWVGYSEQGLRKALELDWSSLVSRLEEAAAELYNAEGAYR